VLYVALPKNLKKSAGYAACDFVVSHAKGQKMQLSRTNLGPDWIPIKLERLPLLPSVLSSEDERATAYYFTKLTNSDWRVH
jgi:hypothetical protein